MPDLDPQLMELWEQTAIPFLTRDGKNPKFPKGGQDIAGNPQLIATLKEIAAAYLPKCQHKFKLLSEQRDIDHMLMDDATEETSCTSLLSRSAEIDRLKKEFDTDLIHLNARSRQELYESPGFAIELARRGEDQDKAASLAIILLGPVINCAVAAACEQSGYIVNMQDDPRLLKVIRGFVPKEFGDDSKPESAR